MPEHFKRATGHARQVTDAVKGPTLDLTTLTDQEEQIIQAVIQKDEVERSILEAKISEVRKEIQEIRKAGALTAGDDQNAICARCKFKFMPFIVPWADHGQRCTTCKFRVCVKCRTQQPGGSWLCILCFKYRQEKQLSGEFMSKGQPIASSLFGSDLLRASLRDRSRRRYGYVEADGVNYIQRPAKTKQVDSDAETAAASFSTLHAPEELRKEQSLRSREGAGNSSDKNIFFRQVARSSHIQRATFGGSFPRDPESVSAARQLLATQSASLADQISNDGTAFESLHAAEDGADSPGRSVDATNFDESGTRTYCSVDAQLGHRNSTGKLPHEEVRTKRAFLNRIISISEQTLYYDDVKMVIQNMPRFSSLDSRSTSSLYSDYSINPKYRSLKPSSGTSELELFRKRGERYSMKRKRTLEESQSEEKNDIRPDTPSGNTSIDSGVNQTGSEMTVSASNNTSKDPSENQISAELKNTILNNTSIVPSENQTSVEVKKAVSNNTLIDSSENQISSEVQKTISNNTLIDSSENQTSSEVQKTNTTSPDSSENQECSKEKKTIPHWHEILRMQSVVEALTKQNKSPTAASTEPLDEAPEACDQIFSLVKPKLRKTSAAKILSRLTPSNSKDSSSSSQESISVYVASYMSPTTDKSLDQWFTSTPKTKSNSSCQPEPKNSSLLISSGPEENITTLPKEIKHTDLNLSPNGQSKQDLPRTHKQKRNLFNIRQSRNGPKRQDWRGKRKLPTLDRVTSLKRENSNQVKWPAVRRQDSYSQAVKSEEIPFSPPKGNADRQGQWCKDVSSQSLHANTETDPLKPTQNHDSDTSSVNSFASDSQYASRTNSIGSSDGSRSLQDASSIDERKVQTIVVRGNIPAVLPSRFQFRRSSSSLTESQRSDSLDSSSSCEKSVGESNINKSPAVSRTSAGEVSAVKNTQSCGGDDIVRAHPREDNPETVNSFKGNNIRTRSVSQDSFDDVYNSNANLFVQMMNSDESAKDGNNTKEKLGKQRRLLPRRPGEGKNLQVFLQKSVSLSEEMAENARFQSFDEDDKEVLFAETGKAAKDCNDDVLEEKLLLPSEIRKRQSSKDSFTSKGSSGQQQQASRIPIKRTPSFAEKEKLTPAKGETKMVPGVLKEETLSKANSRFGSLVTRAGSTINKDPSEVDHRSRLKQPHQLEVKQRPEVTRLSHGRPDNLAVNLSRSGSNVSDANSNVTEHSELYGKAERYEYGSDHSSDDTFHNSSLDSSFSDDDNPGSTTKTFVDSVKSNEVMDHSLFRKITNNKGGRSKGPSHEEDAFRRMHYEEGVKSDNNPLHTDHSGDRDSQMSSATEDSNPEGYYQGRESSIGCHASDLDHEDFLHSTLSRESTESHRDTLPGNNDQLSVSIQREFLEGVGNNNPESQRGGFNEECSEFVDSNVLMEEVSSIINQCFISAVVDAEDECLTREEEALVPFSFKHPHRLIPSPMDHFFDSYLPDATMDLDCTTNHYLAGKIYNIVTNHPTKGSNRQVSEPPKVADGDPSGGHRKTERHDVTLASSNDRLSVPSIAVTNIGVEQSPRDDEDEEDDFDELFNNHKPNTLLGSRSSLADSRESIYSVYSDAGEVNYGRISVTGEIMFKLNYNYKTNTLEVHIIQCKDLAPVDAKHNKSDPYVKTYLLPDKSRGSKRKTRIKKHTLSPIFDEILKYPISKTELETRSLWVTVWHNDRFGRNDFLGEVTIPLDYYTYNDNAPRWYPLQERTETQDPMMCYRGDLFISLKFVTPDRVEASPKKKSGTLRKKAKEKEKPLSGLGEIHVLVKEAQNLTAMRGSAGSDPFCKGYLLPDESHGSKQKTPVIRKTTSPHWQHILVFEGVDQGRLPQHGLELTIWDFERLSSNDFLGGVRLNLGQGCHQGKPVDWMDARGEEIEAWQSMMDHPNEWVDAQLPLRVSMSKESIKK